MQSAPVASSSGLTAAGIESAHCQKAAPDLSTSPGPAVAGACVSINAAPIPSDAAKRLTVLFMLFMTSSLGCPRRDVPLASFACSKAGHGADATRDIDPCP